MNSMIPLKLRDDNNNKHIAMQMVGTDRQPLGHHLIQRINHHPHLHPSLSNNNNHHLRVESSPPENRSSHILHHVSEFDPALEASSVKGHRGSFNLSSGTKDHRGSFNLSSGADGTSDEQLSCSPMSSSGDDQVHHSMQRPGQERSPAGRKRRKHPGPHVRPTCNECGKDFSNQSALSKHKLTHSDVRRFSCEICQKAFKRQDHLNGHMLTHREKKPYECDVEGCEKTYCDARSLRRHRENHHSSITVSSITVSSHTPPVSSHVASSALRSLLSGHPGALFPHHTLMNPLHHQQQFSHNSLEGSMSEVLPTSASSNQIAHLNHPPHSVDISQSVDMSMNQGFHHSQGFSYAAVGNDEMRSPHPPPRIRTQQSGTHAHHHPPPPPIVLNQASTVNSYNSHSVPTTPTTHPQASHPQASHQASHQAPVSAEPLPSPHHLSVNNGNHYGSMNGHQQSHPCTPTQPVNTFSFSPHQVQQYHQQQEEQSQNGVRSLPTTPTEHQDSPSTPVVGYVNGGHAHYHHLYQHAASMQHGPRSLPATPADHPSLSYHVQHQASYNDPNPSPYSVASQSSPYDLHQPASHLRNQQQSNSTNYQSTHQHDAVSHRQHDAVSHQHDAVSHQHDPASHRQQLHSTGTYEDHDMTDTYQGNDIDDYDLSQLDVQNLMEHIQSHQEEDSSTTVTGQSLQPPMESQHQSFYPQTEPITPTTPATPTPSFHPFPIPNKFQAHNFRSNVIHQNQDNTLPSRQQTSTFSSVGHQNQDSTLPSRQQTSTFSSVGKSMSQMMDSQHVALNQQQQMLQVPSSAVTHREDVTTPNQSLHQQSDAITFQVPSLVRNLLPSTMNLKQPNGLHSAETVANHPAMNNSSNAMNNSTNAMNSTNATSQTFGSSMSYTGFQRHELRSTTPPNLVVNLSPMNSRPTSSSTLMADSSSTLMADSSSTLMVDSSPTLMVDSSNITMNDEVHSRESNLTKSSAIVNSQKVEEDDDVFSPHLDQSNEETMKVFPSKCTSSGVEKQPNQKLVTCESNQKEAGVNAAGRNQSNLKRSHETGGVIVHGTDPNVHRVQQNLLSSSNNLLLLQALQKQAHLVEKAHLLEKGVSNENKKPSSDPASDGSKVEIRSPKRMRHKPEPIYIPPQVNAFGVSNHFSSTSRTCRSPNRTCRSPNRTCRSPRIWDGHKGSHMNPVSHNVAFSKLNFSSYQGSSFMDQMSKMSPPPYTPPPMLSPVRTSFGYYYHINFTSSGTPKVPLGPSLTNLASLGTNLASLGTNLASIGTNVSRKTAPFTVAKDGHSMSEVVDQLNEKELEVKTPMTAYEPFPEFATSFDSERNSEGEIQPHVNVGPSYQARIPAFNSDKESAREKYKYERGDLVWDPSVIKKNGLGEEEIISFLQVSCSLCIPGSGRNQEYAHHLLSRAKGDLGKALVMLMQPRPKINKSDPLYGYHYSETDLWSTQEITAYHQALVKCDKDFNAISREMKNRSVKECIQFYYLWKKVCPDEYRKLRIIRRKREQDGFHAVKSIPAPILEEEEKQSDMVEVAEDQSLDAANSRSCSPILTGSLTCPDSDGSSMTGFDSMNPSPAPSSTGSFVNNNNQGESGFPCKQCGKVFSKIKSRSAHMKIHGEKT